MKDDDKFTKLSKTLSDQGWQEHIILTLDREANECRLHYDTTVPRSVLRDMLQGAINSLEIK